MDPDLPSRSIRNFNAASRNIHRTYRRMAGEPTGPGNLEHLEHIEEPFFLSPQLQHLSPLDEEKALVQQYLEYAAGEYGLGDIKFDLDTPVAQLRPPEDEGQAFHFADRKSINGYTVFTVDQTHFGIPVWQSGFCAIMQGAQPGAGPLRVVSSQSTLTRHAGLVREAIFLRASLRPQILTHSEFAPDNLDKAALAERLGEDPAIIRSVNKKRLLIYQSGQLSRLLGFPSGTRSVPPLLTGSIPSLKGLPDLPSETDGKHYIVTEVVFTTVPEFDVQSLHSRGIAGRPTTRQRSKGINWRAFVEIEHGWVLYLRPLVSSCFGDIFPSGPVDTGDGATTGWIFCSDPLTQYGTPYRPRAKSPGSVIDDLNGRRRQVNLNVTPVGPGERQILMGTYIQLNNDAWPPYGPVEGWQPGIIRPEKGGVDFNFTLSDVLAGDGVSQAVWFTNVNAYYHFDAMFRMMESLGFKNIIEDYFRGDTVFPLTIDPYGTDGAFKAEVHIDSGGDGVMEVVFGPVEPKGSKYPAELQIGDATDVRIVLHEFCHTLLIASIHDLNFEFAHSAGDSLAAILSDPGSRVPGPDRADTFPWVTSMCEGVDGYNKRYHDVTNDNGYGDLAVWGWGGDRDTYDIPGNCDPPGYLREQILAVSLFRLYQALGGADRGSTKKQIARQSFAARYTTYLIIQAIYLAGPARYLPIDTPELFVTALQEADNNPDPFKDEYGEIVPPGALARGAVKKVIRWSFEKQGLYRSQADDPPMPPETDVYIEDGRNGEYTFTTDYESADICNRHAADVDTSTPDPDLAHQDPQAGKTNYIYVKVKNRSGVDLTSSVSVTGYYRAVGSSKKLTWDGGSKWTALGSDPKDTAGVNVDKGESRVVGPFTWKVPSGSAGASQKQVCVLMSVSADGDPSTIDPNKDGSVPYSSHPIPLWWLVPNDNNIGIRKMTIQA